jgi:hypothetical protein
MPDINFKLLLAAHLHKRMVTTCTRHFKYKRKRDRHFKYKRKREGGEISGRSMILKQTVTKKDVYIGIN